MSHTRYKIFNNDYPHFLTSTILDWLPLFTDPAVVQIILNSMNFMIKENRLVIYAYVIMKDHLHMIASSGQLSNEFGKFRSYTARSIIDRYKHQEEECILHKLHSLKSNFKKDREYQLWQEGVKPKQIISHKMMEQKVKYIHYNPVRKEYVDKPEHWRYSSVSNYYGGEPLVDVCTEW